MRSAILVDSVLNYEVKGEHIHITDDGGGVHLAMSRNAFLANIARARAVATDLMSRDACEVRRIGGKH